MNRFEVFKRAAMRVVFRQNGAPVMSSATAANSRSFLDVAATAGAALVVGLFGLTGARDAYAQAAYSSGGSGAPSSIEVLVGIAVVGGIAYVLYKRGVFNNLFRPNPALTKPATAATVVDDGDGAIDALLQLSRKARLGRKIAVSSVIASLIVTGLFLNKIRQTSEMALRYDDGVHEQMGYWGIALVFFWLISIFYVYLSIAGKRAIATRKQAQIKAMVEALADLEIQISKAPEGEEQGQLKAKKVRLESSLRQLEAV